jgi:hypothetical protein
LRNYYKKWLRYYVDHPPPLVGRVVIPLCHPELVSGFYNILILLDAEIQDPESSLGSGPA